MVNSFKVNQRKSSNQSNVGGEVEIYDTSFSIVQEEYFGDDLNDSNYVVDSCKKQTLLHKSLNNDNLLTSKSLHLEENPTKQLRKVSSFVHTREENYRAGLLLFFSCFLYSLSTFCGKVLGMYYPDVENASTNFIRGIVMIILSLIYFHYYNIDLKESLLKPPREKLYILMVRASFGSVCNIFLLASLKYMRISTSFTIFNLAPIFTTILTVLFLNGKVTRLDVIAFVVCFFSLILITKPGFIFSKDADIDDQPIGIFFAFLASIMSGIAVFLNKMISIHFDNSINVFCMGIGFALYSFMVIPFTTHGFSTITFSSLIIIILLSTIFFVSFFTFVISLSMGDPIKILPITYVGIVLNLIYNTFIFRQSCDILDVLGSIFIIFINVYKIYNQ